MSYNHNPSDFESELFSQTQSESIQEFLKTRSGQFHYSQIQQLQREIESIQEEKDFLIRSPKEAVSPYGETIEDHDIHLEYAQSRLATAINRFNRAHARCNKLSIKERLGNKLAAFAGFIDEFDSEM